MEVYEQLTVTSLLMLFKDKIVMLKKHLSITQTNSYNVVDSGEGEGRRGGGGGRSPREDGIHLDSASCETNNQL